MKLVKRANATQILIPRPRDNHSYITTFLLHPPRMIFCKDFRIMARKKLQQLSILFTTPGSTNKIYIVLHTIFPNINVMETAYGSQSSSAGAIMTAASERHRGPSRPSGLPAVRFRCSIFKTVVSPSALMHYKHSHACLPFILTQRINTVTER
jgi:hypothetical protein